MRVIDMCEVNNCQNKIYAKSLCNRHYLQMRKHGKIITTKYEQRPAVIDGDVALIPLGTGARQGYAKVDAEYSWVDKYLWSKHHKGYAHAAINGEVVSMHRLITNRPVDKHVDHANHDTLDNRLSNLRICTRTENRRNSNKAKNNTTGYKGVVMAGKKFAAQIGYNGKKLYLGLYDTAQEASLAYDNKAAILHGDFAKLNNEIKQGE